MRKTQVLALMLGVGGGVACNRYIYTDRDEHCANHDGNPWCDAKYPGEERFCVLGTCAGPTDGCSVKLPMDESCYAPCGEDALSETPSCDGVAEDSSSSGLTDGPTTEPTTEPTSGPTGTTLSTTMTASETEPTSTTSSGCVDSSECGDAAAPICFEMQCVPCGDAGMPDEACADKDAGLPVCGEDGACVQCTPTNPSACGDTTPFCDGPSSSCIGCTYHEQCSESACRIATGACFEETEVYDVGDGQTYEEIRDAVTDLGEGVQVVLVLHAGASFDDDVTLSGVDTAYAFISEDDPPPQWIRSSGMGPTLRVESMAEAYVQNVRLTGNLFSGAAAIEADGASLYLDRTDVAGNTGGGIALTNAATAHLRNSIIGGANNRPAAEVASSSMDAVYSTFAGAFGASPGLLCTNPNEVVVRNSIIVAQADDELDCSDANITFTATEQLTAGMGNVMVGALQELSWFDDYDGSEFTLSVAGGTIFEDIAVWRMGDPATDIGADVRPNVDGTADFAGADVP